VENFSVLLSVIDRLHRQICKDLENLNIVIIKLDLITMYEHYMYQYKVFQSYIEILKNKFCTRKSQQISKTNMHPHIHYQSN
jgi:hypothetical protein